MVFTSAKRQLFGYKPVSVDMASIKSGRVAPERQRNLGAKINATSPESA